MKRQGTIVRWDKDRGFGFIRCPATPADIFFHVKDYAGPQPIREGQAVVFDEIHVGGKGPRAVLVKEPPARVHFAPAARAPASQDDAELLPRGRRPGPPRPQTATRKDPWPMLGLVAAWLLLWLVGIGLGRFPWVVLSGVVLVNIATVFLYWRDKVAAEAEHPRTPENHLHALALAGGWPAAWLAQQVLRHKTVKQPFRRLYWATVGLNTLGLLGWIVWPAFGVSIA